MNCYDSYMIDNMIDNSIYNNHLDEMWNVMFDEWII